MISELFPRFINAKTEEALEKALFSLFQGTSTHYQTVNIYQKKDGTFTAWIYCKPETPIPGRGKNKTQKTFKRTT